MSHEPLEKILQPSIDESRIAANWQRIRNGRSHAFAIPRWTFGAAFACAAAFALYIAWPARTGPLDSPVASVGPGDLLDAPADRKVAFDDGSRLELERGARLQVLTNDGERFVAQLQHGRVHFDVHPGGPRRWEIETARATVEVVGTEFTVESDEHHVVVAVERGVVMVRGEHVPDRVVRLVAGKQISLDDTTTSLSEVTSPSAVASAASAKPAVVPTAPTQVEPPPVEVAPPAVAPTPTVAPTTIKTAVTKLKTPAPTHPAAKKTAKKSPPLASDKPHTLADALADADQLRAAGNPAGAAELLEHSLTGARHDESAGLAEFTLGRLYLEELDQPDRAEAAFARMIDNGSPTLMLEDAHARRIEALVRLHHDDQAAAALAEYDRLYPHGVHHTKLHALIAK